MYRNVTILSGRGGWGLFFAAVVLVAGEVAGFGCGEWCRGWGWAAGAVGAGWLAAYGWGWRRAFYPLVFLTGAALALRTESMLTEELERNAGMLGEDRSVVLTVEGRPRVKESQKTPGGKVVDFYSSAGPVPLKVVMEVGAGRELPQCGEKWRCRGWISKKETGAERYRRRRMWVGRTGEAERVEEAGAHSPARAYTKLREELSWRLGLGLEGCEDLAQMVRAILVGERTGLPGEMRQRFIDAGTLHVFAISGLHVMAVAMVLGWMLGRLDMPLAVRGMVMIPALAGYVLLAGARASVVRAALMACMYMAAPVFGRRPNSFTAWSATALLIYGISPERVYDLGCTFSFAVMLGIVAWVERRPLLERFGDVKALEPPVVRRVMDAVGFSAMAWAASVPVAAAAFGRITPGGLLANFAVVWCAGLLVPCGLCGLALSFLCEPLAALCNMAAAGLVRAMAEISRLVAELEWANFEVEPWTWADCAAWYLVLGGGTWLARRVLFRWAERRRKMWWAKKMVAS